MHFLAIDPGCKYSGFVVYSSHDNKIISYDKILNEQLKQDYPAIVKDLRAIVLIETMDYAVQHAGLEVLNTMKWIGKFSEVFPSAILIGRGQMKKQFGVKNDTAVRKLIQQVYPHIKLKSDCWQAFLLIHAYNNDVY